MMGERPGGTKRYKRRGRERPEEGKGGQKDKSLNKGRREKDVNDFINSIDKRQKLLGPRNRWMVAVAQHGYEEVDIHFDGV